MFIPTRANWGKALSNKMKEMNTKDQKPKLPIEPIVEVPYRKVDYERDLATCKAKIEKLKSKVKILESKLSENDRSPFFVNRYYVGVDNFSTIADGRLDLMVEIFYTKKQPIIYVFGQRRCKYEFSDQKVILKSGDLTVTGTLKLDNKLAVIVLDDISMLSYPCQLSLNHLIV